MGKFSRKGVSKYYFLDTLAAGSTTMLPTRTELTAGTLLNASIAAIDGFSIENQEISTPNMATKFNGKIPGDDEAADSTITFYEDETTSDIETALAAGAVGWIVILRKGDIPANTSMDVFPVRVASISAQHTVDNEAAKFMVKFSITDPPVTGAAVPAAA
jgi:hypothetical protein